MAFSTNLDEQGAPGWTAAHSRTDAGARRRRGRARRWSAGAVAGGRRPAPRCGNRQPHARTGRHPQRGPFRRARDHGRMEVLGSEANLSPPQASRPSGQHHQSLGMDGAAGSLGLDPRRRRRRRALVTDIVYRSALVHSVAGARRGTRASDSLFWTGSACCCTRRRRASTSLSRCAPRSTPICARQCWADLTRRPVPEPPHRLDRHGQVDHCGQLFARDRRRRSGTPTPTVSPPSTPADGGGAGAIEGRWRRRRRSATAPVDRDCLRGRGRCSPTPRPPLRGWRRRSGIRWWRPKPQTRSSPRTPDAPLVAVLDIPLLLRDRRPTPGSTASSWSQRPGRAPRRPRVLARPGMPVRGRVRAYPGPPRSPTPRSARAPISLWTAARALRTCSAEIDKLIESLARSRGPRDGAIAPQYLVRTRHCRASTRQSRAACLEPVVLDARLKAGHDENRLGNELARDCPRHRDDRARPIRRPSRCRDRLRSSCINRIPTGRVWHCHLNPEREVPYQAFEVHGLSTEFLRDKPALRRAGRRHARLSSKAPCW